MGKAVAIKVENKKLPEARPKVSGFLPFGEGDLFPQVLMEVIFDSDVAGACARVRQKFIVGNGFNDMALSRLVVNRQRMRLDKVLHMTAWNVSVFETIALHVGYDGLGRIASIKPVPVELVRLCEPDDLGVITHAGIFRYIGSTLNRDKRDEHLKLPLFNPDPEVVQAQIIAAGGIDLYKGQLLYETMWTPGDGYYHTPSYFHTPRNMETDNQLSVYDFKNVVGGFASPGMIAILSEDAPAEQKSEPPVYDPYGEDNTLEGQLNKAAGADNTGNVIVYRAKTKEELAALKFLSFTGNDLADRYESTGDRVARRICRQWDVPSVLADVQREGSSIFQSENEMRNLDRAMQRNVNPMQRFIKDTFTDVFQYWRDPQWKTADFTIQNLDYFANGTTVQAG